MGSGGELAGPKDAAAQDAALQASPMWRRIYTIRALAEPQSLPRMLGVFAQRSLVPQQVFSREEGEWLVLDVEVDLGDPLLDELVLERLRSLVCVERVSMVRCDPPILATNEVGGRK